MEIYIVAFNPSKTSPNGTGGYDWFYSKLDAKRKVVEHLDQDCSGFDYHYLELTVPPEHTGAIEEYIEQQVELP